MVPDLVYKFQMIGYGELKLLKGNQMRDDGATALAQAFKVSTSYITNI
jgi:hypothetical protein